MTSGASASVLEWATHARATRSNCQEGTWKAKLQPRTRSEGWTVDRAAHFLAVIGIHLSVNWLGVKNLSGEPREADLWSGWGLGG